MCNQKDNRSKIQNNNKGFSLVELLISMVILIVIMLPLLNNFVVAARVNAKARKVQNDTNLAQSIAEDIKSKTLLEIATNYNDNTIVDGDRTTYNKKIIRDGKHIYDVRITLDKDVYKELSPSGDPLGYNNFKMPIISDINETKNVIVTESYETSMASSVLYSNHKWYREQTKNEAGEYTVAEHTEEDISRNLERNTQINITYHSGSIMVEVEAIYTSSSIPGADSESYTLKETSYNNTMKGIYYFFYPIQNERISIHKENTITDSIDVFIVSQDTGISPNIIIENSNVVTIYSNVTSPSTLVKKDTSTRLYDLTIEVYQAGVDDMTTESLVTFHTTKEE